VTQAKKGVICIYVGIGKKDSAIKYVEDYLKRQEVFENCIIVHTAPDDSPTLLYLAPYSGMTIAEYFRDQGFNSLIILDDLTTHAKVVREISLLLKRVPGRDSYPGEIFSLHAQLLERAGNIQTKHGVVSITALPVAETLENDISGYIQTNLMAMTDGHIFFDLHEFRKGKRPAINAFLSVSRVGNQTKTQIEKEIASWVRKKLLDYQRILDFVQFGAELSKEAQETLEIGKKLESIFNQGADIIIPKEIQIILMGLFISDFWEEASPREIKDDILKLLIAHEEGKLPLLREKIKDILNLEHLQFLIKEILPTIEKILK
ncbi:F0F1 ATP synthase subunit alpha, partial [Candidatus Parcubacteria bacterium]|nr:F0F1 ATP synthase subunit alpha [Candidatus Parcubacteria bacterium]